MLINIFVSCLMIIDILIDMRGYIIVVLTHISLMTTDDRHFFHVSVVFVFLFLKFIYFNWRLITLQHCSGFGCTLT